MIFNARVQILFIMFRAKLHFITACFAIVGIVTVVESIIPMIITVFRKTVNTFITAITMINITITIRDSRIFIITSIVITQPLQITCN